MKFDREIVYALAQKELSAGKEAKEIGNLGKARVCARRGCGLAIEYWLQFNPNKIWGSSAISMLSNLKDDLAMPEEIRDAAVRLTRKVDQNFETGVEEDPINDGEAIIKYFLDNEDSKEI